MSYFIAGFLVGAFVSWMVTSFTSEYFFNYLTFKKKQEFEKEKYYSEYAERYKGNKR